AGRTVTLGPSTRHGPVHLCSGNAPYQLNSRTPREMLHSRHNPCPHILALTTACLLRYHKPRTPPCPGASTSKESLFNRPVAEGLNTDLGKEMYEREPQFSS